MKERKDQIKLTEYLQHFNSDILSSRPLSKEVKIKYKYRKLLPLHFTVTCREIKSQNLLEF